MAPRPLRTRRRQSKDHALATNYGKTKDLSLAAGMRLGLFAQIGLLAHLFSLLVPALGQQLAGFAAGLATAAAIAGRTLVGWLMPRHGTNQPHAEWRQ